MKRKIKETINHPLITGSVVIFFGTLLANFFNFLFNLFMMRNLSVGDYGILASLVSLVTIASIPAGAFVPTIVRFGGFYFAKNDYEMLRGFYFKINRVCFFLAFIFIGFFIIFSQKIGLFFRINDTFLILLVGLSVAFGFIGILNIGILQAKLSFGFLSFINLSGAILKLIIGTFLVYIGFAVNGALIGFFMSALLPYLLSFIPLGFLFGNKSKTPEIKNNDLISYGIPSAITLLGLTSLITSDIILVKHFFDPKTAGIYAGVSLIGRIIFFLSAPIGTVMFPLVVQKHTRKENYLNTFLLAGIIVLLPSILLTFLYFLFPEFIISFFSKGEYAQASYLLGIFGIYITVYSLFSILANFYLSIKKTNVFIPIGLGAILQLILIWFFHDSFLQIIFISLGVVGLLLVGLLIYCFKIFSNLNDIK